MAEVLKSLDQVGICLQCGARKGLTKDHFYPRCLVTKPSGIDPRGHPLRSVIDLSSNVFVLCYQCHEGVDQGKIRAFRGDKPRALDPEAGVQYLWENYPLTANVRYFDLQRRCMMETNRAYAEVVARLNGELPPGFRERFQRSGQIALQFNDYLDSLRNSQVAF